MLCYYCWYIYLKFLKKAKVPKIYEFLYPFASCKFRCKFNHLQQNFVKCFQALTLQHHSCMDAQWNIKLKLCFYVRISCARKWGANTVAIINDEKANGFSLHKTSLPVRLLKLSLLSLYLGG